MIDYLIDSSFYFSVNNYPGFLKNRVVEMYVFIFAILRPPISFFRVCGDIFAPLKIRPLFSGAGFVLKRKSLRLPCQEFCLLPFDSFKNISKCGKNSCPPFTNPKQTWIFQVLDKKNLSDKYDAMHESIFNE